MSNYLINHHMIVNRRTDLFDNKIYEGVFMEISNCGLVCAECNFYQKECEGCYKVKGKTFWAEEMPGKVCPLYFCAIHNKKLKSCGECDELPCKMFLEIRDPNISDEEYQRSIEQRVKRLKA